MKHGTVTHRLLLLAATLTLLALPGAAVAQPADDDDARCEPLRCAVKADIDRACPCPAAKSFDSYISCVAKKAKRLSIPKECREEVVECAAKSLCGKKGAVVCLVPGAPADDDDDDGFPGCSIQKSASKCTAKHGMVATDRTDCCLDCIPPSTTTTIPVTTTTTSTTSTTSTTTTTTTLPPCSADTAFSCHWSDGTECFLIECPPSGTNTCEGIRSSCISGAIFSGVGPGDCPTLPCTDCSTGQPCQ